MIIHIDMDAFYASVEERERPELVGQPVVVGGSSESRSVVSAANYKAREFGIHSAMPMSRAVRLCPGLVRLPVRMDLYAAVSEQIQAVFGRYTPQIEPLALDEAFLDVRASEQLYGSAEVIARRIKDEILQELQLVASVGVAPNKFLAKLASDIDKPDGFVVIRADQVQAFLDPLPVSRLWGVGKAAHQVFERLGVRTIGEVRHLPPALMTDYFGKHGAQLLELAHGRDRRAVETERQAKSVSNETTFAVDIHEREILQSWLLQLTEQVGWRLRQAGLKGRTVHLKIRFADFRLITRSITLEHPSQTTDVLWQAVRTLLADCHLPQAVRLIGMGVSQLTDSETVQTTQGDLFAAADPKKEKIDAVADAINARFGKAMLHRASSDKHN
ncbi:MAG: DNA polymerase IV [Gammaproteobacteria bacterium]|nr:DNA polymerase IV [Gammaproteobacteria bacterium]